MQNLDHSTLTESPTPTLSFDTHPRKASSAPISAVVAQFKRLFWETGQVPTAKEIAILLKVPTNSVIEALSKPTAIKALAAFYIPRENPKRLTLQQVVWVNMLLNLEDTRSIRKKADEFGIKVQQHQAWMQDRNFADFVQKRAFQIFGREKWQVMFSLLQNARTGDTQAQKLYLEMTGDYTPSSKVNHTGSININVQQTVNVLIEVIQQVVSPEQLAVISEKFEHALSGKTQKELPRQVIDVNPFDELDEQLAETVLGIDKASEQSLAQSITAPVVPSEARQSTPAPEISWDFLDSPNESN